MHHGQLFSRPCRLYLQNKSRMRPRLSTLAASTLDPTRTGCHLDQRPASPRIALLPLPSPPVRSQHSGKRDLLDVGQVMSLLCSKLEAVSPNSVTGKARLPQRPAATSSRDLEPPPLAVLPPVPLTALQLSGASPFSDQGRMVLPQSLCPCSSPCLATFLQVCLHGSLPPFPQVFVPKSLLSPLATLLCRAPSIPFI